jgi:hypothetical protein
MKRATVSQAISSILVTRYVREMTPKPVAEI